MLAGCFIQEFNVERVEGCGEIFETGFSARSCFNNMNLDAQKTRPFLGQDAGGKDPCSFFSLAAVFFGA